MFKIGDIIEGTQTGRWVLGRVYEVHDFHIKVDVIKSDIDYYPCTWSLLTSNCKLSKNQVVLNIINDL